MQVPELTVIAVGVVSAAVALLAGWLFLRADRLIEEGRSRRRRRGPSSGTVLGVATVAGALGVSPPSGLNLRLIGLAAVLGAVGLVVERRRLRPSVRVGAEAAAGGAAVVLGLESGITGTAATNALLVVAFVVVVVESLRLLDAAPRAAAAVAAPAAVPLGVLAAAEGQPGVATLALALAGALVGLLAAGTRRAFWLGEPGCLFAGFLLATLVVAVGPATPAPLSVAVVLPVLGLALLNAAVVTLDRLRRRRPLTQRRPDGLAHRLRATQLPWSVAILALGVLQAVVGAVVVLADRDVLPAVAPLAVTTAAGLALIARARSRLHRTEPQGLSPVARLAGVGLTVVAGALVVPAALALVSARADVARGAGAAEQGLAAAQRGEVDEAETAFDQAETAFAAVEERLDGSLVSLGLAVPVLGPNLAAARTLSALGAELAGTGAAVATAAPADLALSGGNVPVEEIRRLAPGLADAAGALQQALSVSRTIDPSYLLPSVREGLRVLDARLARATIDAEVAAQAASVVPAIFGADGPRRYFLAIQNNAELRATGGFLGSFGELVAEDGRVRLERIGRVRELNESGPEVKVVEAPDDYLARYQRFEVASTWQNVNLSPDLPTVGQVIAGLYPQSGGGPVDGVIAVDPVGLAGILELTGAVEVPPWPEPISPANVAEVTLNQAYVEFNQKNDRIDFNAEVAEAAISAFTAADLGSPRRVVEALGEPAQGGHLAAWFTRPEEQALAERIDLAAEVEPVGLDSLLVVNQNAGGNKLDYYLRRATSYDVQLRPEGDELAVSAYLQVAMENQAPDDGLPRYIIGPYDERFEAGENFSIVSLYTPLTLTSATWDGAPVVLEAEEELGRNVYSAFLSIPSRSTRTLEAQLEGSAVPLGDGWYELDLLHQPLLVDGEVTVSVSVAPGWRIAEAQGAQLDGAQRALARLTLARDETVRVRLVEEQ